MRITGPAPRILDPQFCEAVLPTALGTSLRLNPHTWTRVAGLGWLCGWSPGAESRSAAFARTRAAVDALIAHALRLESVALVGHGIANMLIARNLRRKGWSGRPWPRGSYWWWATYQGR